MSLIQSARLNGHDPYRYLKDVLERLPTQPASRIGELLPHSWMPATTASCQGNMCCPYAYLDMAEGLPPSNFRSRPIPAGGDFLIDRPVYLVSGCSLNGS